MQKMEGIIIGLLVVVQNFVSGEVQEATQSSSFLATSTRDPYANVLSQLSDVMFDVEERLYKLTAPKYESENLKAKSDEEKDNLRRNYFDRIRDNYKTLQDQIGQSFSSGGIIKMSDILNLNFQNKGSRSAIDLSLPFLPLNIKVDAKKPPPKESSEKSEVVKDALKLPSPFSDISGSINLGVKERPEETVQSEKSGKPELQKRSSRPTRTYSNKKTNSRGKSTTELFSDYSKKNNKNSQDKDLEDESGVQGRILGDLLFSESTFDNHFRRLLKDHGKWLFDSNILPSKQIIEGIRDITRDQFTGALSQQVPHQGSKSEDMPFNNNESKYHDHQHSGSWRQETETRVVLAFTPEGLPLKLKFDHSISKPLKFLHKILSEARVSLNIPVSTTNGIQHAGNGVLHLGFEDREMPTRTPLLDLSDNNQLNYLLRTLKKLKYEHH